MKTILHAGNLYSNYLVLYENGKAAISIQVDDHDTQWDIYCKDVEILEWDDTHMTIRVKEKEYTFPYLVTPEDLGWTK